MHRKLASFFIIILEKKCTFYLKKKKKGELRFFFEMEKIKIKNLQKALCKRINSSKSKQCILMKQFNVI